MIKWAITFIFFSLLSSCSWFQLEKSPRSQHEDYLQQVKDQRQKMPYEQYRVYVKRQLERKQIEMVQLKAMQMESRKRMDYNQAGSNASEVGDISSFKVQSGEMEQRRIQERINFVKSQLLFLNSQLD